VRSIFLTILFILFLSLALLIGPAKTGQGALVTNGQSLFQEKPVQDPVQDPKKKPAQEPVQDQDDVVRLSSRLILVPVSASNASGNPVKDLKVEDIIIEEEGRPQKVVALGEPGKTPVEIALLFDVSGSTNDQFAFQQLASVQFIKEVLKPSDAVSVFSIGLTPKMVKARTTSSEEAVKGLMSIVPLKEPTAFFDALVEAAHYLDKNADSGSRRVLVVISDGEENFSKSYKLNDALRELQKTDCLFYAINPSGDSIRLNTISIKGQGFMESMASQTGGKAFNLRRTEELESVFRQIAEELQAQYLFGYYSTDERNETGFRRITVRAPSRPELRIRTRQGYYVSKT
jgi:Ca-activated chloride channel family protein